jgi:hypothetical protein
MATIWTALINKLKEIDGTGDYWNDVELRVLEGGPDWTDMGDLPCIFVGHPVRTPNATRPQLSRGRTEWGAQYTIWGCVASTSPRLDAMKLEQDILRVLSLNPGLGCASVSMEDGGTEYEINEVDQQDDRIIVGVCQIQITFNAKETFL